MNDFLSRTLGFLSQFTGGGGGVSYAVPYGFGALFFALLLSMALFQSRQGKERERLLVWGFALGLGRELFMLSASYLQYVELLSPDFLHMVFPPLEHALSNLATVVIAAAFLRYLLDDRSLSRQYLNAGLVAIACCYLATFWWWADYIMQHPTGRFGQTWCDWLFRCVASFLMLIAIVLLNRGTRGWVRQAITLAFGLFFLAEALKMVDMALGENYERYFTPIRHGAYLLALPVFGYVYLRETYEEYRQLEHEQTQMQNHLRLSNKMEALGAMAGGIAHDFNNMLFVIIGNIQHAQADVGGDSALMARLQAVEKAAFRSHELVKQILAFSRKSDGAIKAIDSSALFRESTKLLRTIIPATVEINQRLEKDCGTIEADPTQLHQVLMNLAINAVQAMREKGTLTILLRRVTLAPGHSDLRPGLAMGAYQILTVSDTGPGIEPAIAERIFEPFFTTKEADKGTGMGLAVVQGIVKNHGGEIYCDSWPGAGATFTVYFPAQSGPILEAASEAALAPIPRGSERVLCIDDEQSLLALEKGMLELHGYRAHCVSDSREALFLFRADPGGFDLIITDQTMPGLDGLELAREIHQIRPDLPIILCSGYSSRVSDEALGEIGIRRLCPKPMTLRTFLTDVRAVLDEARALPAGNRAKKTSSVTLAPADRLSMAGQPCTDP
jgi:signal transduction histidine kinase/CheY-like chemotaxis protein